MKAILEVGAARFIVDGHSFESLCREVVHTLSSLVAVDPHTICLRCTFDSFVTQAINEAALIDEAERHRTPGAVDHDWRRSAAAHRVLSGRRFSGVPTGVTPMATSSLKGNTVRVGPAVEAASRQLYMYSQDTFEAIEVVLAALADEAKTREVRMLALGLLSAPRETATACALPTIVLDTFMSTSAPVSSYYDANGQPCRRRSAPTAHEESLMARPAPDAPRQTDSQPAPEIEGDEAAAAEEAQAAILLPPEVKEELERQSYAPYLRELVKPGVGTSPAASSRVPDVASPAEAGCAAPHPVRLVAVNTLPVAPKQPRLTPTRDEVETELRQRCVREVQRPAAHPQTLPQPPLGTDDGLVESPPSSGQRGGAHLYAQLDAPLDHDAKAGPTTALGLPPTVPRAQPPPPSSDVAPALTAQRPARSGRAMVFQRGGRVDVAELVTGKASRPTSATAQVGASPPPPQRPSASLPSPDPRAVPHAALGASPFHVPAPPAALAERRHSAGQTSIASSSAQPSGMRTPLPGITAEERQVVDRLLQTDDMTPLRQRTPSLLRSMPITGSSTNVDVTSSDLLPVSERERLARSGYASRTGADPVSANSQHPYNAALVDGPLHGVRPTRLSSAPSPASRPIDDGRSTQRSGGARVDGSLPRVQSAPRGDLAARAERHAGTSEAWSNYNKLFSFTPVSDKYAKLLEEH